MRKIFFTAVFLLLLYSLSAGAISIGISPGKVVFENVLREGYSERTVTISTSSDEEVIASIKPLGDIKEWIKFEPNSTTFTLSKDRPYRLKMIVQPPNDLPVGNYSGYVEFLTEGTAGVSGRAGSVVKTAVNLFVGLELTGTEIVDCRAGAFHFNDAERGFPFEFGATVINDGNVRLRPIISIDIWDQLQEKLLLSREITAEPILPTTEKKVSATLPNSLEEGQYWADMKVAQCKDAGSLLTFNILEKGGIADKGNLVDILNKPWVYTNETVQITAKFENTGQRSVNAKFKGTIRLDDRIVKVVETDEVIVPAGEAADFDVFFAPEVAGRYTVSGRVVYNKKLTFEKGTVINVNAASEEEKQGISILPLIIYAAIIVTIVFIARKIIKERKRKF